MKLVQRTPIFPRIGTRYYLIDPITSLRTVGSYSLEDTLNSELFIDPDCEDLLKSTDKVTVTILAAADTSEAFYQEYPELFI